MRVISATPFFHGLVNLSLTLAAGRFAEAAGARADVTVIEVTAQNRERSPAQVADWARRRCSG